MNKDKFKVGVTSPSFCNNGYLRNQLLDSFPNSIFNPKKTKLNSKEMLEYFIDVDAMIVSMEKIDASILEKLKNLKVISKFGVGMDNIDLKLCNSLDIQVNVTPGLNKVSVAEMTISFMIALSRNMYQSSIKLKNGIWDKSNGGNDISHKNVGIIGCNNVGKEVVRMLEPFHCNIFINDLEDKSDFCRRKNIRQVDLDFLIKNSDIISLHLPLNNLTENLININQFKLMKKEAIIINTSRGKIINEKDLFYSLKNNLIKGAALDVYDVEPPNNKSLIELQNLLHKILTFALKIQS